MNGLLSEVRSFWERNYRDDVAVLNDALAKEGRPTAGFETAPPSVLTGNPFSLSRGDCIGVIGLNPKWQPGMTESNEIRLCHDDHTSANGFSGYAERRARYFLADSTEYYGRYFSKLQNRLAETFLCGRIDDPRSVFQTAAFKIDLLPWWSSDTSMIDERRIDLTSQPLLAWKRVIQAFIDALQPRALVLNGCGMRQAAALLLNTRLEPFAYGPRKAEVGYFGDVEGVPVLAHRQLNAIGAPASSESYGRLVRSWRERVGYE